MGFISLVGPGYTPVGSYEYSYPYTYVWPTWKAEKRLITKFGIPSKWWAVIYFFEFKNNSNGIDTHFRVRQRQTIALLANYEHSYFIIARSINVVCQIIININLFNSRDRFTTIFCGHCHCHSHSLLARSNGQHIRNRTAFVWEMKLLIKNALQFNRSFVFVSLNISTSTSAVRNNITIIGPIYSPSVAPTHATRTFYHYLVCLASAVEVE